MVVQLVILQNEGHGPVAQALHIHLGILQGQLIGHIEEIIGASVSAATEPEAGGPAGIQRDSCLPGKGLAAPLQEQVGIGFGFGIGIGIPQEEAGVGALFQDGLIVGQYQEDAAGVVPAQVVQQLRKRLLGKGLLQVRGAQEPVHVRVFLRQEVPQDGIEEAPFLPDGAPLVHHGAFQHHFPVLHNILVQLNGVFLHGLLGAADNQCVKRQETLKNHHQKQWDQQQLHQRLLAFFHRISSFQQR